MRSDASVRRRFRTAWRDQVIRAVALIGGRLSVCRCSARPCGYSCRRSCPERAHHRRVNALNTVWVLLAAFLVFCMQVRFVVLRGWFRALTRIHQHSCRRRVDTCICGVTFWAWGFAFMFEPGNSFIGTTGFFLRLGRDMRDHRGSLLAFWVFQLPSPTRAHCPGRWSGGAGSSGTFSTASASPASSLRSSATGPGDLTAGWRR